MAVNVRVLTDREALSEAFTEIAEWARELRLAYAWVTRGEHWDNLPLDKISRAIVGTKFEETDPDVLRELQAHECLKIMQPEAGVFHPKLLIGIAGTEAKALVGSSNFTRGGFGRNTEVNVLISGPLKDSALGRLVTFIDEQWKKAKKVDDDALAEYELKYANSKKIRHLEGNSDLDVGWSAFVELLKGNPRGNNLSGYLDEAEKCRKAFKLQPQFAEMGEEDRKLVAGWGGGSAGWFGRMGQARHFKRLTGKRPNVIAKYLDRVPLVGACSLKCALDYLEGITHIKKIGFGSATRLLCMKRPDLFLGVNGPNKKKIHQIFGVKADSIDGYRTVIQHIWNCPWFTGTRPESPQEHVRIWRARVAILDAYFYEPSSD